MHNDVECPYCSHPQNIDHDDGYGYEENVAHQQECSECGNIFVYNTSVMYNYDVHQAACLNGGEHEYQLVHHYPRHWPSWVRCKLCDDEIKGPTVMPEVNSSSPRIAVFCRLRNEMEILPQFIEHYTPIATAGIYFFDDLSNDGTYNYLKQSKYYVYREEGEHKGIHSDSLELSQRYTLLSNIIPRLSPEDFILLVDADEFVEFNDLVNISKYDAYYFRMFDTYTTAEDKLLHWKDRDKVGPEYREITMMCRVKFSKGISGHRTLMHDSVKPPHFAGFVKHVGKSISFERWESKCAYYSQPGTREDYRNKWAARKGKYIHEVSDFGRPLITYDAAKSGLVEVISLDNGTNIL